MLGPQMDMDPGCASAHGGGALHQVGECVQAFLALSILLILKALLLSRPLDSALSLPICLPSSDLPLLCGPSPLDFFLSVLPCTHHLACPALYLVIWLALVSSILLPPLLFMSLVCLARYLLVLPSAV